MSMFLVSENFTSGAGMSYLVLLFANHHDPFLGEPDIILYVCAFHYSTEQLNIVCHDVDSKAVRTSTWRNDLGGDQKHNKYLLEWPNV